MDQTAQGLEDVLGEVLSNPEKMQQILDVARSLGLEPPNGEDMAHAPEPAQAATSSDKRQENLLRALKPFLRPSRQEKLDRAMQVARLSHLAEAAFRAQGSGK